MEMRIDEQEGVYIFQIDGLIDFGYCRDFEICVETLIRKGVDRIVFEMSGLDGIVSAGISALIRLAGAMHDRGGRLALAAVPPRVRTVLARMTLDTYFEFYETEAAAVAALAVRR